LTLDQEIEGSNPSAPANLPPARLIETAPGTFAVRLENLAVRNGPDPQEE
jgi:hypothetical protein